MGESNITLSELEIDALILRYWPIERAMQGKIPDYEDMRKLVREVIAEINKRHAS